MPVKQTLSNHRSPQYCVRWIDYMRSDFSLKAKISTQLQSTTVQRYQVVNSRLTDSKTGKTYIINRFINGNPVYKELKPGQKKATPKAIICIGNDTLEFTGRYDNETPIYRKITENISNSNELASTPAASMNSIQSEKEVKQVAEQTPSNNANPKRETDTVYQFDEAKTSFSKRLSGLLDREIENTSKKFSILSNYLTKIQNGSLEIKDIEDLNKVLHTYQEKFTESDVIKIITDSLYDISDSCKNQSSESQNSKVKELVDQASVLQIKLHIESC